MKRWTAILLMLMILFLSGCSESSNASGDAPPADYIWFDQPIFDDYEKYLGFLSEKRASLHKDFVTAEDLFVLGKWSSFRLEWPSYSGQNSYWYSYLLKFPSTAVSGFQEGDISIYHDPENTFFKKRYGDLPKSTLTKADYDNSEWMVRITPREDAFRIVRNGVEYLYIGKGALTAISWELDGIMYVIYDTTENNFDTIDRSSVLGRLLSLDNAEAKAAFNEIKKSLTK